MRETNSFPNILMPLPDHDYDMTEASVPWKACTARGWHVDISTEHGDVAQADISKLKGPLPGLLSVGAPARTAYGEMIADSAYQHPIPYADIDPNKYDAILLPGGDGLRMRQYLESATLRGKVLEFSRQVKLIGAICHGVLVPARTLDPQTGHSILYGRKVTAPPRSLDRFGDLVGNKLTKRGYLVYSCYVEEEVRACLEHPGDFSNGGSVLTPYAVTDGNLITSRWYHDAELFAARFCAALQQHVSLTK